MFGGTPFHHHQLNQPSKQPNPMQTHGVEWGMLVRGRLKPPVEFPQQNDAIYTAGPAAVSVYESIFN